jgi:hypothetical protein
MDRFKEELSDQLGFIAKSSRFVDAGDDAEAKRIALALRILFHDTGNSVSLLRHLGAPTISMLSTMNSPLGPKGPGNLAALVYTVTAEGHTFQGKAPLDAAPKRFIPFADWWDGEIVCMTTTGVQMTRKDIVLALANKDGGAHVDAKLKSDYVEVKLGSGIVATALREGQPPTPMPVQSHTIATLRQIAYEVLNSPDLLLLNNEAGCWQGRL